MLYFHLNSSDCPSVRVHLWILLFLFVTVLKNGFASCLLTDAYVAFCSHSVGTPFAKSDFCGAASCSSTVASQSEGEKEFTDFGLLSHKARDHGWIPLEPEQSREHWTAKGVCQTKRMCFQSMVSYFRQMQKVACIRPVRVWWLC